MNPIDLSHTIEHGMITYRGLPAPLICDYLSREVSRNLYAEGTEFHIGRIDMVANTGTYLDSPFHRYADGKDLSELPLETLQKFDSRIEADVFGPLSLQGSLNARNTLGGTAPAQVRLQIARHRTRLG
mgnify:CR=1 FL=1